jgi:hypothetical protein
MYRGDVDVGASKEVLVTKLIIDADLPAKLTNITQPVELWDTNGRMLGRFFPYLDPSAYNLEPQISNEELERRKRSNEKTYTTAEVLAYLEKL